MTVAGRWFRVSGDKQDEQNQYDRVNSRIASQGYTEGKTYVAHADSATKREHLPLLREAIADMRSGLIDCLVMRHTDRIDRTEELGMILKEVKEAGGWIESVDEPWVAELSGLSAKVMTGVTEFMNAEYVRKLSVNVLDAQARRRTSNSWASGQIPYGYYVIGYHGDGSTHNAPGKCVACAPDRGGRKTLIPNEVEAAVVRRIFEAIAAGKSRLEVAQSLYLDGIPSKYGRAAWTEAVIGKMIKNPVHRGIVQHKGVAYMTVEPTVSSALWKTANDVMRAKGHKPGRSGGRRPKAFLKPICGRCGGPMYSQNRVNRDEPTDWATYRCAGVGPKSGQPKQKGCGNTIKVSALDAEVTAEFEGADDAEIIETVISGSDYAEEIAQSQLAIKDLDVMADDYDEKHAEMVKELRRLRSLPSEPARVVAMHTGRSEGDAFKAMGPDERKAFVRLWTLTVYPEGTEPRWKLTRGGTSDVTAAQVLTRWQSETRSQPI